MLRIEEHGDNTAITTGSSFALSSVAAFIGLCCLGPVAVTLFGVSGAVFLARLEPARPYFLVAASLLTLVSAWFLYFRPLISGYQISRNVYQHLLFVISICLILFAAFADRVLWYFQ